MMQRILLLFFFVFFQLVVFGQSPFGGYLVLGGNAAQINGDLLAGYHKIGLTGGVGVSYKFKENMDFSAELLYSQRGAKNQLFPPANRNFYINLNYAEIPFLFTIKDWFIEESKYYKVKAHTGLSFGNLISSDTNIEELKPKVEASKTRDLSFIIGADYYFTSKLGFTVRYTRSLLNMYKNPVDASDYLLGYFLTLRMEYKL